MINAGYSYRERLGHEASGMTVLHYLAGRYRHSSLDEWSDHIDDGRVHLDGIRAETATRLAAGQVLTWHRPPWSEPDAPSSFAVLYRDDDVLAVAKPRGLPAMPGGGFLERTLLKRVARFDRSAAPLHRLGRGTSGITLFTRNRTARRRLTAALTRGEIERKYLALANGRIPWPDATLDQPIGYAPHALLGRVAAVDPDGKRAVSRARVLERRESTSLVEVSLVTGRTHQIRIHLAAAGHPLAGDPLYAAGGRPDATTRALPGDPGYWLHAHRLSFEHPRTGRLVSVRCAPPPALRRKLSGR